LPPLGRPVKYCPWMPFVKVPKLEVNYPLLFLIELDLKHAFGI
jgi:hypothetical protein